MAVVEHPLLVVPGSPNLWAAVRRFASGEDTARRLYARVLLHLPRLADEKGRLAQREVDREVERLAAEERPLPAWLLPPANRPSEPSDLVLAEVEPEKARVIHRDFHYLRSYRQGQHIGAFADSHLAALLTFSPLDLRRVRATLPDLEEGQALVLSRVHAFAWIPRNSLSHILARTVRLLRERLPRPRLVFTYLNPNVGFDGASYKAANWFLYGREQGTRYAYLNQDYITDRELTARFGTSQADSLAAVLPGRIEFSSMPLRPLEMYAHPLDHQLRRRLSGGEPQEWVRPWA
jgi:hypothetical protein